MQSLDDDVFDELGALSGSAICRLRNWYNTAQTEGNMAHVRRSEWEREIRGAIEGVTNISPEYIIIDLDRNDTQN